MIHQQDVDLTDSDDSNDAVGELDTFGKYILKMSRVSHLSNVVSEEFGAPTRLGVSGRVEPAIVTAPSNGLGSWPSVIDNSHSAMLNNM